MGIFSLNSMNILVVMVALTMSTTMILARVPGQPGSSSPLVLAPDRSSHPMILVNQTKPNPADEFLLLHNKARGEVGVSLLKWSLELEKDTNKLVRFQRDNKKCEFADMKLGKYGMNQMWGSGLKVTPTEAVDLWVQNKKYYNYTTNSCAPNHSTCGVYKQVVWNNTLEIGCSQVRCQKEDSTLTICMYNPPGNVMGEKPY